MKKWIMLCILCLYSIAINAQKTVQIKDKDTRETLQHANAKQLDNKAVIQSENGKIELKEGKSYKIFHQGYQPKIIDVTADTADIIYLNLKVNMLSEVMVSGVIMKDPAMTLSTPDLTENVTQPKNVAELFKGLDGFGIIKRGNYAMDPSFRASQYEQLNIQYDGGTKVVHACPNRMDPITTHVVPEDIKQIEVIRGPYSVRYGATFGGIINMVTRQPEFDDYGLSGTLSTGYEGNGNALVNLARIEYAEKKFDFVGTYARRDFQNYEDGNGVEIPSSFLSNDYSIRFGYNFNGLERLQIQWRQSFGRDVLHASLPMDSEYDDSSIINLDYEKKQVTDQLKKVKAKVYYSYVDHLMTNSRRSNFSMVEASAPVEATTAGGKFELTWEFDDNWQIYTGVDAYLISRDGVRNRKVKAMNGNPLDQPTEFTDKIWQDTYIDDYGLFAESIYTINKSTSLNFGVRYDRVISDIQDPADNFRDYYLGLDQRTENNLSGTISAKKKLGNHLLEVAFGRGVRSANMIERAINHFQIGQDPFEYVGNPNLDAEVNHQFEIAYKGKTQIDGFFDFANWNASVYYSDFENYIIGVIDETKDREFMPNAEPSHPKVFRNLEDAYKTGFEAGFSLRFMENWKLASDVSYVYTRNEDLGESLPLTSPLRSNFIFSYETDKLTSSLSLNVVAEQDDLATSFGENSATPGYELLDFKVSYDLMEDLNVGAGVLNIFDVDYYDHLNFAFRNQADNNLSASNRLTNPGRNVSFFAKYSL